MKGSDFSWSSSSCFTSVAPLELSEVFKPKIFEYY